MFNRVYLSMFNRVYLSMFNRVYLSMFNRVYPSMFNRVYLSMFNCVYLSMFNCVYLSMFNRVYLSMLNHVLVRVQRTLRTCIYQISQYNKKLVYAFNQCQIVACIFLITLPIHLLKLYCVHLLVHYFPACFLTFVGKIVKFEMTCFTFSMNHSA